MEPVIADSARKHGVSDADIRHAFRNPIRAIYLDDDLTILIGPSRTGDLLEVGFVEGVDGRGIVHAMSARDKYLR